MSTSSFSEVRCSHEATRGDGTAKEQLYETKPFSAADLLEQGIDASTCAWAEIIPKGLKDLLLSHATENANEVQSFFPMIHRSSASLAEELVGEAESSSRVILTVGLGVHTFDYVGRKFHLVNQRRGPVVGTGCGAALLQSVVLLCEGVEGGKKAIADLCNKLLADDAKTKENVFTIYRWNVRHAYWEHVARKSARSIDSVVLPSATKDKIIDDLNKFLTVPTYEFYVEHGIPYKRSYLFYGEPGAGKTSLIQALAGKYNRNLCIMQPTTDKKFNDDSLADAIKDAPSSSIIVLEDVDALFDKNRKSQTKLSITFSGLLNALDGIANPDGQIFVMTTNFRDNLDAALVRNGRVDLHVEFSHATEEQMERLFAQFYPKAPEGKASDFRKAVVAALGGKGVNMCALQHYFITQRESTADEAIANVQRIIDDMKEKEEGKGKGKEKEEEEKEGSKKGSKKAVKKTKGRSKGGRGGGDVHVYINSGRSSSKRADADTETEEEDEREEEEEEEEHESSGGSGDESE